MAATLEGRVAFVTGGASGIGRGVAERLARDGADVCVADIDREGAEETARAVEALGRKSHVVKVNVASPRQLADGVSGCVQQLGRLDIAIANAGIARAGTLVDMDLKAWQDQVDVNLTGVFLTAQACARQLLAQGDGGRIVCTASLAALTTTAMVWSYSATKAAVAMMVRGWAQELGPSGITVNAIGPGVIETPLARGIAGDEGGGIRRELEKRTPVGRVGQPADIAGLVSFLVGPDAEFMTGSYVLMDGGFRDSQNLELDPERIQELGRHIQDGMARNARLQPLIDER